MNKDQNNLMRNINNSLRKNYRILCDLNPEGKTKTTRNKMSSKGFDFDLFTSILKQKQAILITLCMTMAIWK